MYSGSTLTSEQQYLDANLPNGKFKVIQSRIRGLEYSAEDYGDSFFITTNHEAKNFRLMKASITNPTIDNWNEVISHREEVRLEGAEF